LIAHRWCKIRTSTKSMVISRCVIVMKMREGSHADAKIQDGIISHPKTYWARPHTEWRWPDWDLEVK